VSPREITEAELRDVLAKFYEGVRADPVLGPVFNGIVDDWDSHMLRLEEFWSSLMLSSGRYKGNPVAMHMMHAAVIKSEMFERWLELWRKTTDEILSPEAARLLQERADRIAVRLQLSMFGDRAIGGPHTDTRVHE